ncbi:MAG TPA: hypothetical protein VJY62_09840 [Bacteroidia bacterium]|nr:hypothetical protein [Bacteroidia bacterium]
MNKIILQKEILESEKLLLNLSEKVFGIENLDSMADWIIKLLELDSDLHRYLHFPSQKKIKKALSTLIKNDSDLTQPLLYLLSNRIGAYIATIDDIYNHPFRSAILDRLSSNFESLFKLLNKYRDNYEHIKTVSLIADALIGHRLNIYKSSLKETDLRVVLRTLYEDTDRSNKKVINTILNFVFSQLQHELKKNGYIQPPRHCWWAVNTIFSEAEDQWLRNNKTELNKILKHLLSTSEIAFSPRTDIDYTNIVPEIDSAYNEKTWIAINAIRLLKNDISPYIPEKTIKLLKSKVAADINIIIKSQPKDSIKFLQSKLIVLYEALNFYNIEETMKIISKEEISLNNARIGNYFYDESVTAIYNSIASSLNSFISKPSLLKKPTLSSMLLSGSPGQGKSELAIQISNDIESISQKYNKSFVQLYYTIGTQIKTDEDLFKSFKEINSSASNENTVKLVIFDEFDKASFDFYTPFLPFLERPVSPNFPIIIFIFAQSSYPTYDLFLNSSKMIANTAMRDFLTRLQLGHIDIPDIKFSPEQKILSVIGMAKSRKIPFHRISKKLLGYFALNEKVKNLRELFSDFTKNAEIYDNDLVIKLDKEQDFTKIYPHINGWINIKN